MLITAVCLLLTAPLQELPASPEARRAAVETGLITVPWIEGHSFGIEERMRMLNVPGASVAVIHDGKIDWAAGYGVRDTATGEPVTAETMFQAASISKPVSAMAVLSLAQAGALDLDAPINDLLSSWQLPEAEFDGEVTPRRILSHTAGLGVHGFPGYGTHEAAPAAVDVVSGRGNTDAVLRIEPAGKGVRYSGGGSTVMQLAVTDVTGKAFADVLRERVLEPLGMQHSTYAQPLPTETWPDHAAAHDWGGRQIAGRFHVYPEQFAAGLWTTPSDLARFALELQALAGKQDGQVLEAAWGETMLTPEIEGAALGLFLERYDDQPWFGHGGSNEGFKCMFRASFEGGHGVVVMTNGDQGNRLADDIVRGVAQVYGWPGVLGSRIESVELSSEELDRYTGRYAFGPDEVLFVHRDGERLFVQNLPDRPYPIAPLGEHRFQCLGADVRLTFERMGPDGPRSVLVRPGFLARAQRLADDAYWPSQDLLYGNAHAATAYYRDVHEINPDDPMVAADRLIELAAGLWNYGPPEAGLALMQTAAELYPEDAGVWDTLAQLQAGSDQIEAAAVSYRNCLEHLPNDPALDAGNRAWLEANAKSMLRWLEAR